MFCCVMRMRCVFFFQVQNLRNPSLPKRKRGGKGKERQRGGRGGRERGEGEGEGSSGVEDQGLTGGFQLTIELAPVQSSSVHPPTDHSPSSLLCTYYVCMYFFLWCEQACR